MRRPSVTGVSPFSPITSRVTVWLSRRYDDRGVGLSTGNSAAATSAEFATDARAAVRFLLTRPEIDRDGIGFIGHSEVMVAQIAAVDDDQLDFVICSPGLEPIDAMSATTHVRMLARRVQPDPTAVTYRGRETNVD